MRKTEYFPFEGGENHSEPALSIPPGELIASSNYEMSVDGGYRRIDGFERFDGGPKPSDALRSDFATEELWIADIESRRAAIDPVPGSGAIRGVWYFNGKAYAFRDNVAGTACIMWESTGSGWAEVQMNYKLDFINGDTEIFPGDTIVGTTSGATTVVSSIHVYTGTWGGGDAAGEIHFNPADLTGSFQSGGEPLQVGTPPASADAVDTEEIEYLPPGGRYELINYNFYGSTGSAEMYGVNGVGEAFAYDGTDIRFIHTGMPVDKPTHIFAFKNHLFLSFPGGSVQHSSLGEPDEWSAITGAAEVAVGDEITGFSLGSKDSLVIFCRNSTNILYGQTASDWYLSQHSDNSGAIEWSIQRLAAPIYLDDRGVTNLAATDVYGDFAANSMSRKIDAILKSIRSSITASLVVREKDQYRIFFGTNGSITLSFKGSRVIGITRQNYGISVVCTCSAEDTNGNELLFFGCDSGYIYQIDSGTSFDGQPISAWVRPAFNHFKSPENLKRFFKVVLEIDAEQPTELTFLPTYDYGGTEVPSSLEGTFDVRGGGGFWDSSLWDAFYYDSPIISTAFGYLNGVGKNFSLYIRSEQTYVKPHTLQGAIIHYSPKGLVR